MSSEIRVNKINNRAGLGTITIADTGVIVNGIVTCTEISGLNALNIAGVSTFASPLDINGDIDVDGHTNLDNVSVAGVSTFAGDIVISDSIVHSGDNHTKIRFPTNDQISFENSGTESMRIFGYGQVLIGDGVDRRSGNAELTISGSSSVILADNNPLYNQQNPCFLHLSNANNSVDASETGIIFHNTFAASGNVALYAKKTGNYANDLIFRFRTGGAASTERVRITSSGQVKVGTGVTIETNGQATFTGIVTASSYRGDGSQLTGISAGVAGIDTTGQSHLKLLFVNAGIVTFTNISNPTPSATLPSGTGGHIYSFDNALNIVGASGLGNGGIVFQEGGFTRWRIISGHFRPHSDSTVDIGTNSVRVRNIYADTLYGDGANLSNLPAGAPVGGASTNTVFFENAKEVAVNYQITTNKNAMSAGPLQINAGIAVTVPSGSAWTIV